MERGVGSTWRDLQFESSQWKTCMEKTLKTLNPLLLGRKEEKRNNSLEGVEFPRWLDQSPFSASPLTL